MSEQAEQPGEKGPVDISPFAELSPPYSTIVADPPWSYAEGFTPTRYPEQGKTYARNPLPYSALSVDDIAALPVGDLAADASHLYLWTTNRYLRAAFGLLDAWGFRYSQTLTWCKPPQGIAAGGAFTSTTEFVLFGRKGSLAHKQRVDSSWWEWSRAGHSVKPAAFLDLVEQVSPGPYVELFARNPRLGWDSWGHGYEIEMTT